jgi:hypothetical protein
MALTGLDVAVLVRCVVQDEPKASAMATRLVEGLIREPTQRLEAPVLLLRNKEIVVDCAELLPQVQRIARPRPRTGASVSCRLPRRTWTPGARRGAAAAAILGQRSAAPKATRPGVARAGGSP